MLISAPAAILLGLARGGGVLVAPPWCYGNDPSRTMHMIARTVARRRPGSSTPAARSAAKGRRNYSRTTSDAPNVRVGS